MFRQRLAVRFQVLRDSTRERFHNFVHSRCCSLEQQRFLWTACSSRHRDIALFDRCTRCDERANRVIRFASFGWRIDAYLQSIAEVADRHHAGKSTHPWYGSAQLDPGAVLADVRRHVIHYLLRPTAGTTWIGFKEVRYEPGHFGSYDELLQHLIFLGRLFPGLRYVINVREPVDAARSGWWPENTDAIEVLTTTRDRLLSATADLNTFFGSHRAACVAYEDWVADPQVLIDAYSSLGLPRDDKAVRAALLERLEHGSRPG